MSHGWYLPRRGMLGAVACGGVWLCSAKLSATPPLGSDYQRVRSKLITLLPEPTQARRIGVAYLRSPLATLAPPGGLVDAVLFSVGANASAAVMRRDIAARIRLELRDVRLVSLDGWLLSETEARLCGLACIS